MFRPMFFQTLIMMMEGIEVSAERSHLERGRPRASRASLKSPNWGS